jgi:tetratricopeptide (TPR) repeat protein
MLTRRAISLLRQVPSLPESIERENQLLDALARYDWNVRSSEHLAEAAECCNELLRRQFNVERSYSLLASTYALLGTYMTVLPADAFPEGRRSAAAALQVNPRNPEAQLVMAFTELVYDWRYEAADEGFCRAIALDPHSATAYQWHSLYYVATGQFDRAIKSIGIARSLDVASPMIISSHFGWVLYFARRFADATRHLKSAIELDPGFWRAYLNLGFSLLQQSRCDEAVRA